MCCFLCFIWVSALQLSQRTHTYLVKYIVKFEQIQFREIHFAFCFAFSKYQGWGCLQRHTSLNAGLLTVEHQQHIWKHTVEKSGGAHWALRQSIFFHTPWGGEREVNIHTQAIPLTDRGVNKRDIKPIRTNTFTVPAKTELLNYWITVWRWIKPNKLLCCAWPLTILRGEYQRHQKLSQAAEVGTRSIII